MTRKLPLFSAVLLSGLLLLAPASWAKKTEAAAPAAVAPYPAPVAPEVAAKAFLLIDISANGQVLASKNADDPLAPARVPWKARACLSILAGKCRLTISSKA